MSMNAVALVKIDGTSLEESDQMKVTRLDDAVLITTTVSVRDTEPEQLGLVIRALLGDALDGHDDERGVFTFPAAAKPDAKTYAAAIEEVGEMGEWVPRATAEDMPAGEGDLAALAGDLLGGMGPDVMELQKRMMAGDPTAMQDAMKHVGAILADPSKQAALMQAASAFMSGDSPLAGMAQNLPPGMNPMDMMQNMDLGALQKQAQEMMEKNPDLEKQLRDKLEGGEDD